MRRTQIATLLWMSACGGGDIGESQLPDTAPNRDTIFVPTDAQSTDTSTSPDTTQPEDTAPPQDTNPPEDTAPPQDTNPPEDTAPPQDTNPPEDTTLPQDTNPPEDTALPQDTNPPEDTDASGPTDTDVPPPVCDPPCVNGSCVADNVCNCEGVPFEGALCELPGCRYPCLNGGVCAPSDCDCTTDTVLARYDFEINPPSALDLYTTPVGLLSDSTLLWLEQADPSPSVTNPAGNGSAESLSSNAWSNNDSLTFAIMAPNHGALSFAWHQTRSSTGPSNFRLEWRVGDTGDFTALTDVDVAANSWSSSSNSSASRFGPYALPSEANQADWLEIRLRLIGATPARTGTIRFDNIELIGTSCAGDDASCSLDCSTNRCLGPLACDCAGTGYGGERCQLQ